jgi:anti-sigma factor RsiW
MCCELYERWVMDLLLGELSDVRTRMLREHEETCPQCKRLGIICKYVLLAIVAEK